MYRQFKKITLLLSAIALIISSLCPVAFAADNKALSDNYTTETINFKCYEFFVDNPGSFEYSDEFFSGSSYDYSRELMLASLGFAASSFDYHPDASDRSKGYVNVLDTLLAMHFENIYYSKAYTQTPKEDSIACAIGSKKLEGGENLIAVTIRSGGYSSEWSGNFNVGTEGNHKGFDIACSQVFKELEDYIADNSITGKTKFWIAGYSRGAACANLLSARLQNTDDLPVVFEPSDIFTYTFETPFVTDSSEVSEDRYTNIFNLINIADPVPGVPPSDWNFSRYGINIYYNTDCIDSTFDFVYMLSYSLSRLGASRDLYTRYLEDSIRSFFKDGATDVNYVGLITTFIAKSFLISRPTDDDFTLTELTDYFVSNSLTMLSALEAHNPLSNYELINQTATSDLIFEKNTTDTSSLLSATILRLNGKADISVILDGKCVVKHENTSESFVLSDLKVSPYITANDTVCIPLLNDCEFYAAIEAADTSDISVNAVSYALSSSAVTEKSGEDAKLSKGERLYVRIKTGKNANESEFSVVDSIPGYTEEKAAVIDEEATTVSRAPAISEETTSVETATEAATEIMNTEAIATTAAITEAEITEATVAKANDNEISEAASDTTVDNSEAEAAAEEEETEEEFDEERYKVRLLIAIVSIIVIIVTRILTKPRKKKKN